MNNTCKRVHDMSFFRDNVSTSFYKYDWTESLKTKLFEMQQSKFLVTQSYIEKCNQVKNHHRQSKEDRAKWNDIMDWMERTVDWTPDRHAEYVATVFVDDNYTEKVIDLDDEPLIGVMPCCYKNCKGIVTCAVRRETSVTCAVRRETNVTCAVRRETSVTSNYKCGLCQTNYCNTCRVIKTSEEHTCDPDTVASVKLIKESAKPCPTCKTSITKIDGCDQMWCPQCKTAFSYNTGKIETGRIHNPHYYQFLRQTQGFVPREQGDEVGCPQDNELVHAHALLFGRVQSIITPEHNAILDIHRQLLHIDHYRPKIIDLTADTRYLRHRRIKYLTNEITKEDMCKYLIKNYNNNIRTNEVAQVYEMVVRSVNDTLRNLSQVNGGRMDKEVLVSHCVEAIATIKKIVSIANDAFEVIAKRWKVKAHRLDDMLKEVKTNAS